MRKYSSLHVATLSFYQVFLRNYSLDGTISTLTHDLDRIKDMKFDFIYLTPIHPIGKINRKGTLGSPYAIQDYKSINPEIGTLEDFKELLTQAHAKNIKIMIDVVFNHTSPDSFLALQHPEWFIKNEQGLISRKIDDWMDVVDFDFTNLELQEYLIECLEFWVSLGVDGFRCDVASLVPLSFWIKARERINSKREILMLSESVEKNFIKYLRRKNYTALADTELYEAFDITYDYDGFEYLKQYFSGQELLDSYINHLYIQETLYPLNSYKLRFLENHDNMRAACIFDSINRLKNWTVFSMMLDGPFLTYMGQEYAIREWPNLFDKMPVDWSKKNNDFFDFFSNALVNIISIKKDAPNLDIQKIANGLYLLKRSYKNELKCVALVNLEDRYGKISLPFSVTGFDTISKRSVTLNDNFQISKEPLVVVL